MLTTPTCFILDTPTPASASLILHLSLPGFVGREPSHQVSGQLTISTSGTAWAAGIAHLPETLHFLGAQIHAVQERVSPLVNSR